ncbi:MAG: hypothetical protein GYB31_10335 [Bacteroidetes bacterium]|nr:hypothetical protein [Bacteroidota bacterium]
MGQDSTYYNLTEKEFGELILKAKSGFQVVVFNAEWLGSGQMQDEIIEEVSEKFNQNFEFYRVEKEKNEALALNLGVSDIPVIFVFKEGKVVRYLKGLTSKSLVEGMLDELISEN